MRRCFWFSFLFLQFLVRNFFLFVIDFKGIQQSFYIFQQLRASFELQSVCVTFFIGKTFYHNGFFGIIFIEPFASSKNELVELVFGFYYPLYSCFIILIIGLFRDCLLYTSP